jgi:hypothetical protein
VLRYDLVTTVDVLDTLSSGEAGFAETLVSVRACPSPVN